MFKLKNLKLLLILSLVLCISATGQEPLTKQQICQVTKVRKALDRYDAGTKLDVQLSDGSHQIGRLSQTGSISFLLIDPVSGKSEAIDYLNVKRVRPTRKEYISQQLQKTANGIPKAAGIALLIVVVLLVVVVTGTT